MKKITYLPDPGLKAAVEVALELGMPLLITGEPGTGKTQAAYWAAEHLSYRSADGKKDIALQPQVLRFNTKTTSVAKDLFYRYDPIRHFRASRGEQAHSAKRSGLLQALSPTQPRSELAVSALQFISFEALGKAILAGTPERRFVVLVDEIDKAPRDFSNDVLFEFEDMAFRIEEADAKDFAEVPKTFWEEKPELVELGVALKKVIPEKGVLKLSAGAPRPLLILTSNSEKNLPDAFLRRCVFYHIPFPEKKEDLAKIVAANIALSPAYSKVLDQMVQKFLEIRKMNMRKPPATAELIRWIEILGKRGIDWEELEKGSPEMREILISTYPVLAKNREDLKTIG